VNYQKETIPDPAGLVRQEASALDGKNFPEWDLSKEFEKEGFRLGLIFNGMQKRVNHEPPLALFTDKETRSTFAVEPGQSIQSKLTEVRKKFRSFETHLRDRKTRSGLWTRHPSAKLQKKSPASQKDANIMMRLL
jgi:hypothetical protein